MAFGSQSTYTVNNYSIVQVILPDRQAQVSRTQPQVLETPSYVLGSQSRVSGNPSYVLNSQPRFLEAQNRVLGMQERNVYVEGTMYIDNNGDYPPRRPNGIDAPLVLYAIDSVKSRPRLSDNSYAPVGNQVNFLAWSLGGILNNYPVGQETYSVPQVFISGVFEQNGLEIAGKKIAYNYITQYCGTEMFENNPNCAIILHYVSTAYNTSPPMYISGNHLVITHTGNNCRNDVLDMNGFMTHEKSQISLDMSETLNPGERSLSDSVEFRKLLELDQEDHVRRTSTLGGKIVISLSQNVELVSLIDR